ncbi:hypothetical protein PoB_003630200 [Plakobranchus ocellatus]|uniref:G-protein coupled receptors family 1 profile domain-containing protein n=1 Tax=Plakobranchus ocellatus TaxID=259542 RepID=A0AAV4AS78_9GAST|nr:hypothetical protein PoB_003630200 [Plakobranchus ocellatus]
MTTSPINGSLYGNWTLSAVREISTARINTSSEGTGSEAGTSTSGGHVDTFLKLNGTSSTTQPSLEVVSHSDTVVVAVTVILAGNVAFSLFLNILLVLIIQYSPSLRTPPNSHLLNICINNLMLCLNMVLCILCLTFNSVDLGLDESEMLSGLQLFLTYNSLLQYWGTFASIGYYR